MAHSLSEKMKWKEWLQNNPTNAEKLLLRELSKNEKLNSLVEFQAIVCGFIVDFYFPKSKLAIEIDGSVHETQSQIKKDLWKNGVLRNSGNKVLRFSNAQIYNDMRNVIFQISNTLNWCTRKNHFKKALPHRGKIKSRFIEDHACIGVLRILRQKKKSARTTNPKPHKSAKR